MAVQRKERPKSAIVSQPEAPIPILRSLGKVDALSPSLEPLYRLNLRRSPSENVAGAGRGSNDGPGHRVERSGSG